MPLPRLLVIDDLFGRDVADGPNVDRLNLCGALRLLDVTGDATGACGRQKVKEPVAEAVFSRGQSPKQAGIGDLVENDLDGVLALADSGWGRQGDGEPPWSLVLLDLCFYTGEVTAESHARAPGMPAGRAGDDVPSSYFGLRVLERLGEVCPGLPVVLLSSMPRAEVSRHYSALGALGFIPRGEPETEGLLAEYLYRHGLLCDLSGKIVGTSIALLMALRLARRLGTTGRNILIEGETGTGKELLARYIHALRPPGAVAADRRRPFVAIDSGTLSPELFASTLFGHTRDAFTGATRDREGLVRSADGGDLFLDEISNMPPDVQVGLLRVLQEGEVIPVGADKGHKVNVRFLSATNQPMEDRVGQGRFGADLLERLRLGGTISLPPLRERSKDIPALVSAFLARAKALVPGARVHEIVPEALELLRTLPWPRNVRALESAIHQAVTSNPDVEYLFPIHFRFLDAARIVASGRLGGTVADSRGAQETVRTSAALAEAILPEILASSVSENRDVDYQQSKSAIRRVVVALSQEGRLQVPATIAAEAFFDETWRLLRMELKSRSLKWMAGRNPAFQNAARRSSELTSMAFESIGTAKRAVPESTDE